MLIKSRNKKITIDFFTDDYAIYDLFKIEKTSRHKPKWLTKDLPVRHCAGFADMLTKSFVVRSWSDITILKDDQNNIITESSNPNCEITSNPIEHRGSFLSSQRFQHLKFLTPWVPRTSDPLHCSFYSAAWHNEKFLSTLCNLPAIRDFYFEKNWNIHFILDKNNMQSTEMIYTNEPLQYFVPLTDKEVDVNCFYDPEEVNKLRSFIPNFFSSTGKSYFRLKNLIKNKENR